MRETYREFIDRKLTAIDEHIVNGGSSGGTFTFNLNYPEDNHISGDDAYFDIVIFTATANSTITLSNMVAETNTGADDGYIKIVPSNSSPVTTMLPRNTETPVSDINIELSTGDTLAVVAGFNNSHTNCYFEWSGSVTIEGSAIINVNTPYLQIAPITT